MNAIRPQPLGIRGRAVTLVLTAVLGNLLLAPSPAGAVPIFGSGALGSFTGTFDYTAINNTSGTINISLANTSLDTGYITAFIFNIPFLATVTAAPLTPSDPDFDTIGGPTFNNSVSGAPFGTFDIGASTNGSFEGGGPPQDGIATGSMGTFSFLLTGTGLGALTAADFLSTLSVPPGVGSEGVQSFVVRFRGFTEGGSDKVPASVGVIPEPGSLLLLGLGLASLSARLRLLRR